MSINAIISGTWDTVSDRLIVQDEELSAYSNEEATKVFEQWKTDDDIDVLMEIDEEIGSNLLDDAIFDAPCLSPTGPLEELVYMNIEDEDQDKFFVPNLDDDEKEQAPPGSTGAPPAVLFTEQYNETLKKLAESMRRSQETRKSLTYKTPKTTTYPRISTVTGVLSSIEQSTQQLQMYHEKSQRIM